MIYTYILLHIHYIANMRHYFLIIYIFVTCVTCMSLFADIELVYDIDYLF